MRARSPGDRDANALDDREQRLGGLGIVEVTERHVAAPREPPDLVAVVRGQEPGAVRRDDAEVGAGVEALDVVARVGHRAERRRADLGRAVPVADHHVGKVFLDLALELEARRVRRRCPA